MPRPRKLNKALQKFICLKLAEGIDISTQCKLFPDKMPKHSSQVFREAADNDEFNDALNRAYSCYYMAKAEEERQIASPEHLKELIQQFDGNLAAAKSAQSTQLKSAQYQLSQIAPRLSKRWDKTSKIQLETNLVPNITINDFFKHDNDVVSDNSNDSDSIVIN